MGGDAKVERERKWREHVGAWQKSGLSQAAYCRQHGLMQHDFSWWKGEIARRDPRASAVVPTFVPVRMALPQPASYAFELELGGGRVLRFDARVDPSSLKAFALALEAGVSQPRAGLKSEVGQKPETGSC